MNILSMPGIDLLISRDLSLEFKTQLDEDILKKLERELFFKHGMSIKLSIEHFEKFHDILKNNLDVNIKKFETDCIKKIVQVSKNKNNYVVKITSQKLCDKIFNFYGDPESRKILMILMNRSKTISQILAISKILKSPAYRKIENLILDGLILESGTILTNTKRVSLYNCIFDKIHIIIGKDHLMVEGVVNHMNFNASSIDKLGLIGN
jgi:predicted transcriptional regulator